MPGQGKEGEDGAGEDRSERVSRELIELLNELRVALPGVQVLFAFLLAVPFAQGFTRVTDILRASNRMSIAGLGSLALAMTGALMLIADFIYTPTLTIVSGVVAGLVFAVLWYVLPLSRPHGQRTDGPAG